MRVAMVETDGEFGPDLPDGFVGTAVLTDDGDYLLTPNADDRLDELQARVDAAAALAEQASATAQDVALAMRPSR